MKKKHFLMMAVFLALTAASCTSEIETTTPDSPAAESDEYGEIRFSIKGLNSETRTEDDNSTSGPYRDPELSDETQSEEEKKISSLYAVAFAAAEGTKTGDKNQFTDNDTFYKLYEVKTDGNEYSFQIDDFGQYNVCFVANLASSYISTIKAWPSSKTISDFKKLEITSNPGTITNNTLTSGLLMTSDFYGVSVGYVSQNLGEIALTRGVARVDLVNLANGITVTDVVFHNRAVKTQLLGSQTAYNSNKYLASSDVTFSDLNLEGATDGSNALQPLLYTYEQYETGDYAPSIDIFYADDDIADSKYVHTIDFSNATTVKSDGETIIQQNPVYLKRNHLYKITLVKNHGQIRIVASVLDWESGEQWYISLDEIADSLVESDDEETQTTE